MTDYNGNTPNTYIPPLPEGARLFAVNPATGAWHYVNHAGTWQGMPSPLTHSYEAGEDKEWRHPLGLTREEAALSYSGPYSTTCEHEAYETDSAGQPTRCVDCGEYVGDKVSVASPVEGLASGEGLTEDKARRLLAQAFEDAGVTGYARHIISGRADWYWTKPVLAAMLAASPKATATVDEAAINQNGRMRQELSLIGNLISDLERWMHVDPANPDGSWPDLAERIERLKAKATATASVREAAQALLDAAEACAETHNTSIMDEAIERMRNALTDSPPKHERVWTGPGELERTGYIDPKGDA